MREQGSPLPLVALLGCLGEATLAQSPRAANPERPTVATHAYAVAPGYWELEQGVRAYGMATFSEGRAWDFNLKVGLREHVQLGVFGTGLGWSGGVTGVGDLGLALKAQTGLGRGGAGGAGGAVAVVPGVTLPTGNESLGLGAGRVLGSLVAVWSQDLTEDFHMDINVGPVGIGAGRPQLFGSLGLSAARGRWSVAGELFRFTAGAAGPAQEGLLGAVLVTLVEWLVLDAGGVWGRTPETPDQLFVGATTNLGRIFK
jgi:hypothetical protein